MINNSLFKITEVPDFHPIVDRYERRDWWKDIKRKCIEGCWQSGKWMPPELFYYINFHHIEFEEGIHRGIGLPWLRDIDWEAAYYYTEATGFSGFELDREYSCNRRLLNPDKEDILLFCTDRSSGEIMPSFYNNFFKEDGSYKTYIPAKDYIRKLHLSNLGKPLYYNDAKHIVEMSSRGYGKEVPDYQLVETKKGQVRIDSLKIGDKILGRDGLETKITGIYPQGIKDIYKLTFADGRVVECGLDHQWTLWKPSGVTVTVTTKDILDKGLRVKPNKKTGKLNPYKWYLPEIDVVEYDEKELPVDPYILGALIGDGTLTNSTPKLGSDDDEILQEFREKLPDYKLTLDTYTPNNYTISYHGKYKYNPEHPYGYNPLFREIKKLGLNTTCYTKFIPDIYKYSSVTQRLELVKGLMDTDGSINKEGYIEFTNTSKTLVDDLAYVLRSLGIRCCIGIDDRIGRVHILPQGTKHTTSKFIYRLYIRTDKPIFKLTRKLNRLRKRTRSNRVALVKIEKLGQTSQRCITVDNQEHLFLLENFVPTHNSFTSSGYALHNFLFDGARDYDEYLDLRQKDSPLKSETVIGAIDTKYSNKLIAKIRTGLNRLPGAVNLEINGELKRFPSPLAVETFGSLSVGREFNSTASGSTIQHVTFADNPLAANGGRPNRIFIDEVGFMTNLLETWEAIESTQTAAEFRRLTIYGLGTGGLTSGGAVMYAQEIFYDPETYNCLEFEDIWEGRDKPIGRFVSGVYALNKYKEGPDFITNEAKALKAIEDDREKAKKSRSNTKILGTIINKPIKPSEIFLRAEGSFFPVHDLKKTLAELERNTILQQASYKVDLKMEREGHVDMIPSERKPITNYPLTRQDSMEGCVEIYEKPKKDVDGIIYPSRYLVSVDPVDDDGNDNIKRSLQSAFVFDTFTDRIVAEYTERTYLVEDYYENVRKLAMFYNGKILYEAHPYSQIVRLPDGSSKLWKDIKIGDTLFGPNGTTTKVIDIPVHEEIPVYKITLRDGRKILASDSHIWKVFKLNSPKETKLFTTKQMLDYGIKNIHGQHNFFIPNSGAIYYEDKKVSIDPYTLGLILAEGSIRGSHCKDNYVQISAGIDDISFYKTRIPYKLKHIGIKGYSYHLYIPGCKKIFKTLGLLESRSETKFIPNEYLFNSFNKRLELLKGLMDGDGHASKRGVSIYITTSKSLKEGILLLCRSLGINCSYKKLKNNKGYLPHYRINIYTNSSIFSLPRKIKNQYVYTPEAKGSKAISYIEKTAITDIKFSHYEMGKCVTVDNKEGLYLIGDYVLTHNCNKKGLYAYFKNKNSLHMLAETPKILKDQSLIKQAGPGNKALGVNISSDQIKLFGINLILKWLESPSYADKDKKNSETIRSVALLKELISYTLDVNADRVSSLIVLFIFREDQAKIIESSRKVSVKVAAEDEFWGRAFRQFNQRKVHKRAMNIRN